LVGSLTILAPRGSLAVQSAVLATAVAGWLASLAIPKAPAVAVEGSIHANILRQTWVVLRQAGAVPGLLPTMNGVSWFWLAGAVYLSQFAAFAKDALAADPTVVSLFLVMFTVGISIGSLLCSPLLRGDASARLAPWGMLGMGLFGIDFAMTAQPLAAEGALVGIRVFLAEPRDWRLLADLLLTAVSAGVYVVPLYTLLQRRADPGQRARVIAANNVLNALFMTAAAAGAAALLAVGVGVRTLLVGLAAANLALAAAGLLRAGLASGAGGACFACRLKRWSAKPTARLSARRGQGRPRHYG
jgi:acyl-[acyl-carrier-protein]-phospholipid O-acyltransferase/long-chain-fatty-acid--[acyl-carrier-protein] ligase